MRLLPYLLPAAMLVTASFVSAADQPFLTDKARGWFWYEKQPDPPPPKEKEQKPPPPVAAVPAKAASSPAAAPQPGPSTFSVKWFQQNYSKVMEDAIDDPTDAKMDKYRYVTRVMVDKATNFSHKFQERAVLDAALDETNRFPISSAMRSDFYRQINQNKAHYMRQLSDRAGLWVFLDAECSFCERQYPIVKRMAKEHGLYVIFITKQGGPIFDMRSDDEVLPDAGHSKVMQVSVYPATVLVAPPDKHVVVSQGMLSEDLIVDRVLLAAKHIGLLDEGQYAEVNPNYSGLLSPQQISKLGMVDFSDPFFTRKIRDAVVAKSADLSRSRVNHEKTR